MGRGIREDLVVWVAMSPLSKFSRQSSAPRGYRCVWDAGVVWFLWVGEECTECDRTKYCIAATSSSVAAKLISVVDRRREDSNSLLGLGVKSWGLKHRVSRHGA